MGFFDRLFGRKTNEPSPPPPSADEAPAAAAQPVVQTAPQAAQTKPVNVDATPPAAKPVLAKSTVAAGTPIPPPAFAQQKAPAAQPAQPQQQKAPAAQQKAPAAQPAQQQKPAAQPAQAKPASPAQTKPVAQAQTKQGGDLVDELIAAVNQTFIEDKNAPKGGVAQPGSLEVPDENVQTLFAEIASQYARPLKELVVELRRGSATRDWIEICRPALSSISKAARSMNLMKPAERMEDFDVALFAAGQTSREQKLTAQDQARLLERYDRLVEIMPKAFSINDEMQRRDSVIILALLKQIPEVGRVTFDKLYAAGLTSVDVLLLAKKDELAVATGISIKLATQICDRLARYREESSGTRRVDMKAYRQRLGDLIGALKKTHEAFLKAEQSGDGDEKRKLRAARQNLVFQTSILLAELGESEFVKECDKLSFERRIAALEEFLARTAQRK